MARGDSLGQSMARGRVGSARAVRIFRWEDGMWMGVARRVVALPGT